MYNTLVKLRPISKITDPSKLRLVVYSGELLGHTSLSELINLVPGPGRGGDMSGESTDRPKPRPSGKGCGTGKTITITLPEEGAGDMQSDIYDPGCVAKDAFDMDSMKEGKQNLILTPTEREKVAKIDEIEQTITTNKQSIVEITNTANQAKATADNAKETADGAKAKSESADTKSQEALTNAVNAVNTANEAKTISGEAKTEADKAVVASRDATATANAAKAVSDDAKKIAEAAKKCCDGNTKKIDDLTPKVETAKTTSEAAKATADDAKQKSEQAVNTANAATATANAATATANTAKETADQATATSNNARNTANEAKATSDEAKNTANEAKRLSDEHGRMLQDGRLDKIEKTISDVRKSSEDNANKIAANKTKTEENLRLINANSSSIASNTSEISKHNDRIADNLAKIQTTQTAVEKAQKCCDDLETKFKTVDEKADAASKTATDAKSLVDDIKVSSDEAKKKAEEAAKVADQVNANKERIEALNSESLKTRFTNLFPQKPILSAISSDTLLIPPRTAILMPFPLGEMMYYNNRPVGIDLKQTLVEPEDAKVGIQPGKDYFVFAVRGDKDDTQTLKFVVSANGTYPHGIEREKCYRIGGFHTLCADVGDIPNHPLSGFKAGDILPMSVWSLNHSPHCLPTGMVYCPNLNLWVDIYLQSGEGRQTRSIYGGQITNARSHIDHQKDLRAVCKRFLSIAEFYFVAEGSNEDAGLKYDKDRSFDRRLKLTTGGNVDSNNRRMISKIGCEDCCGYMNQIVQDVPIRYIYRTGKDSFSVFAVGGNISTSNGAGGFNEGRTWRTTSVSSIATDKQIGPDALFLLGSIAARDNYASTRGCSAAHTRFSVPYTYAREQT